MFTRLKDVPTLSIWPGALARAVYGEQSNLAVVELDPGAAVARHQHSNEQFGLILEGSMTFTIADETRELTAGDIYCIPGDVPHEAAVGTHGAVVLDFFAPGRSDWAAKPTGPAQAPRWPRT